MKSKTYEEFVGKFEPKKTTDDCYTPLLVYDAVADYVVERYGLARESFVRPFYPGGDYERFDYPEGCIVVDNPPFSLMAKILRFYQDRRIRFFLFSPTMTLFSPARKVKGLEFLPCGVQIIYENGARVNSSFVSNIGPSEVRCDPRLYNMVKAANVENTKRTVTELPKYIYPHELITAANLYQLTKSGVGYFVPESETCFVSQLADQKLSTGSAIFGGGFLISERAAAERAAAERAAKRIFEWKLSFMEKCIVNQLGKRQGGNDVSGDVDD